jgi:hypothetical protein
VQADYRLVNVALCRRRSQFRGLPQLAGVDPPRRPQKTRPGQGVELLDFEQAAPDPAAQFRLREVLKDELGFENTPQIPIGAVRNGSWR